MNPENTNFTPFSQSLSNNKSKFGNSGYDITYNYWYNLPTNAHRHEHYEIFIVLKGSFRHFFNGESYLLQEGNVVLIKPNDLHMISPISKEINDAKHFNMPIKQELFAQLTAFIDYNLFQRIQQASSHICCNASKTEMEYFLLRLQALSTCKKIEIQSHLRLLALCCLDIIKASIAPSPLPEWLADFIEKINSPEYFSRPVSKLYKLAPYSQPQLCSLFKKHFNTTLINYMTTVKINYACTLLTQNNFSIIEISDLAGFMSLSNFNHTFKKVKHCSPSEYRKLHTRQETDDD